MTDRIITKRLVLRRYQPSDAHVVTSLIGDLDVSRWLTHVPHPYTVADAEDFIARPRHANVLLFAITLDGQLIGGVSAEQELGYWLGKSYWGRGYMSEAATALVAEYFSMTTDPLGSGYMLGNKASCNILTKLGFTNANTVDAPCASLDKTVSLQKMTLIQSAFEATQ